LVVALAGGYLLGSIPTSLILGRLVARIDIREHGSGNPGATNVLRVLGWGWALPVLAVDVGKGFLAAWLGALLAGGSSWGREGLSLLAGSSAVAGHVWPAFASFRGGKGVATAAGALFAVQPVGVLFCLVLFAAVVATTRRVGVASVASAVALPVGLALVRGLGADGISGASIGVAAGLAALIVFTHRSNLARLVLGTGPRVGSLGGGKRGRN
jgi:glycerol-3-phosphate acyltransferase PlsY